MIFGDKSGMMSTYATYLVEVGYETILIVAHDQQRMEDLKERLQKKYKKRYADGKLSILTYKYELNGEVDHDSLGELADYTKLLAKDFNNHCSVLVNNIAESMEEFKKMSVEDLEHISHNKVQNFTYVTSFLMGDLRNSGLRKHRSLVINVGTSKDALVMKKGGSFETEKE